MASQHKFIDHTADIAVEITADSFEELIIESLKAYNESVLDNLDNLNENVIELKLSESNREELLVSFLNEVNYLLTVKRWISKSIEHLLIDYENGVYTLTGKLNVCYLTNNFVLKEEIKSVTYHQMEIKKEKRKLTTKIVFDI